MKLKHRISIKIRKFGKHGFVSKLSDRASILDVGCGNASVLGIKSVKPNCIYTGLDIQEHRQTNISKKLIDKYIICSSENFVKTIYSLKFFDAIICSHNLEHVNERDKVLIAMTKKLKRGGKIYLSFPCKESINFPSREGTLNYYDDDTHKLLPPDFEKVISMLKKEDFKIIFASTRYRSLILFLVGLIMEPISAIRKKVLFGTWDLYGFETIIHAQKR